MYQNFNSEIVFVMGICWHHFNLSHFHHRLLNEQISNFVPCCLSKNESVFSQIMLYELFSYLTILKLKVQDLVRFKCFPWKAISLLFCPLFIVSHWDFTCALLKLCLPFVCHWSQLGSLVWWRSFVFWHYFIETVFFFFLSFFCSASIVFFSFHSFAHTFHSSPYVP